MKGYINVVIVQSNPLYKKIEENIKILNEMISSYTKEDKIDIVLFTEMALTGYFFDSKADIEPYTSYCDSGNTFNFCSFVSKKLNCYTFLGYPEKVKNDNNFYNSLMITDREGKLIKSYHKINLFKDDKKWSTPGKNLEYLEIITNSGKKAKLALGICLDFYYSTNENEYEFDHYFSNKDINFIIFPTNWADRKFQYNTIEDCKKSVYDNWIIPLQKLSIEGQKRDIYLLAADRIGIERNIHLLGSSCIVKLGNNNFIKIMNKNEVGTIFQKLEF